MGTADHCPQMRRRGWWPGTVAAVIDRMTTSSLAAQLGVARARRIAGDQAGIASRRALIAADVPRWLIRRELRVGRWQRTGRQTIAVHNGPLDAAAKRWIAVLELGPRAALAGITALQHDGITALTDTDIHVFTPKGAVRRKLAGVVQHESRRWTEDDIPPALRPRKCRGRRRQS